MVSEQAINQAASDAAQSRQEDETCPGCLMPAINDEHVYVCSICGWESCPDCAGRCGCPENDNDHPCSMAAGFDDSDDGWERAQQAFDAMDEATARHFADGILRAVSDP